MLGGRSGAVNVRTNDITEAAAEAMRELQLSIDASRRLQRLQSTADRVKYTNSIMQALRSTTRFASQFRSTGLPRFYSTEKSYEHLLVSTPKPGVGLGMPLFVHSFF